jgi:transposase-like protein
MDQGTQRWTSSRKAELVLAILKKEKSLADVCRENDLKQSEVSAWVEQFLEGGRRNLKINSKDQLVEHRKEVENLQRKIGELVLENDVLKKASSLLGEHEETPY